MTGELKMGAFIAGCFTGSIIMVFVIGLFASNRTNKYDYDVEE